MNSSQPYLPVSVLAFVLMLFFVVILFTLIQLNIITYAYEKIGISRHHVFTILLLSLLGSAINIPIARIDSKPVQSEQVVSYFGVPYRVPMQENSGTTILAVNLGGCVIPVLLSVYLLLHHPIFGRAMLAVAVVTFFTHLIARPIPGLGIAMPIFAAPLLAAGTALLIGGQHTAPVAYIAGSLGTLIGADILNLHRLAELGAPVASIGGAGTSDGIFLTGIIAVLLA